MENTLSWVQPEVCETANAMKAITVLGPISSTDLGAVLPHEHLVANLSTFHREGVGGEVKLENLQDLRRAPFSSLHNLSLESIDTCLAELQRWTPSSRGGTMARERDGIDGEGSTVPPSLKLNRTVVCLTTEDLGRRVESLVEVSQRSGCHVLMATGGTGLLDRHMEMSSEALGRDFEIELTMGLNSACSVEKNHRAGVLVVHIDPDNVVCRNILVGAIRAQSKTGLACTRSMFFCELL